MCCTQCVLYTIISLYFDIAFLYTPHVKAYMHETVVGTRETYTVYNRGLQIVHILGCEMCTQIECTHLTTMCVATLRVHHQQNRIAYPWRCNVLYTVLSHTAVV